MCYDLWVRSSRTHQQAKDGPMTNPPSKPISLRFPNNITLSYFGIEKSVHRFLLYQKVYLDYYFPKKIKTSLHDVHVQWTKLAQCQNFQKPISTTFPAFLRKIHNLCKSIRNNSNNLTSFRKFVGGWEFPSSFHITSHHLGRRFPNPDPIRTTPPCHHHKAQRFVQENWPPKPSNNARCRLQVEWWGCRCPKSLGKNGTKQIHDLDPRMP